MAKNKSVNIYPYFLSSKDANKNLPYGGVRD